MGINTETVRKFKVVHTWTGILSSIMLFIAFYAGALAIFKPEITLWTQADKQLPAGSANIDALAAAFFHPDTHPPARAMLALPHREDAAARIYYTAEGEHRLAYLDQAGRLRHIGNAAAGTDLRSGQTVGDFVDDVHRKGGLPMDLETSEPIIGIVSLLYAVALIAGVVVLLPSLVKDLFLLRITHNVRRMWLDAHNVLGLTSLPFHIVMALTAVTFGLHDWIYSAQGKMIYPAGKDPYAAALAAPSPPQAPDAMRALAPSELLAHLRQAAPAFEPRALIYSTGRDGTQNPEVRVAGADERHFLRDGRIGYAFIDQFSGQLGETTYLPGHQTAMAATLSSFFGLHFGNFGGLPVRILYVILGVLGALVFYSGNLLWIEARLKKSRPGQPAAVQPRHVRWLSSLTVGACLGCVAGLSAGIVAARWLASTAASQASIASYAYYGVFVAYLAMAFWLGAARSSAGLLLGAAVASALVPLSSILSVYSQPGTAYLSAYFFVDGFFAIAAGLLCYLAYRAQRRYRQGSRMFPAPATRFRPDPI
ncbi:PepSY domain-containing protein [Bordetella sp. BOR01]|uniref:PepSY-associated TM helix domain-containing protein n=1 Tax=Bordetella sp. BOR01 TaxID=2854779 RepID=UPI001C497AB6|nr:PepSY-associated TM helix domain-containing protein [Bordetella sp. BOR01]MBV7484054.1 PepSY domain-containing protein [Bordetella sp. BOR01]